MNPPLLLDLFCGRGGWTNQALRRGWRCVGYDITDHGYPGELIKRPLPISLDELRSHNPTLCVASPPCEDFARHHLPWLKTVASPSTALLTWAIDLIGSLGCPVVVECSRFAARHVGGATFAGPYALWGDVPALLPQIRKRKMSTSGRDPAGRAMVDADLVAWILDTLPQAATPAKHLTTTTGRVN